MELPIFSLRNTSLNSGVSGHRLSEYVCLTTNYLSLSIYFASDASRQSIISPATSSASLRAIDLVQ
jgi:hypothetical protein